MKPTKCSGAMKRNPRFGVLAVLLAATTIAVAEMRTWNFKSGATIEAEIVAFPGPDTVKVKRSDGKEYVLPTAYLASEDRAYLATERAKQWKEVSVDKLLGTAAAGRYKKCAVSGKDAGGNILIALLPASVEAVLNNRKQQEDQIADLSGPGRKICCRSTRQSCLSQREPGAGQVGDPGCGGDQGQPG
jgi:hypothetical protein